MKRLHIDYGIDLGTTNSAIARIERGEVRLFQHQPLNKSILPSCVTLKGGEIRVGEKAYDRLTSAPSDTYTGFKRTMGHKNAYTFSESGTILSSEQLSAEVLKQLKLAVKDDTVESAVITVPAAFKQIQIEATRRAAELAGFAYAEFLMEPIAASLAFFRGQKSIEGTWLVFDLGGGTFDAALVRMEDGIMKVLDHEGDEWLGGRDMDELIATQILLPDIESLCNLDSVRNNKVELGNLMGRLRVQAEKTKIDLSEKQEATCDPDDPIVGGHKLNVRIKRRQLEELVDPLVTRAISICETLLNRSKMTASDLKTILMIGGPTYMPIVRERVSRELGAKVNVTIDPMTAVAQGAALYASTRKNSIAARSHDRSKTQIILAYPTTTAENEVMLGIRVDPGGTHTDLPNKLFVQVDRNDGGWSSGRVELKAGVGTVRVQMKPSMANGFNVDLTDGHANRLECEPNEFSILQGIKLAQPPLPFDIGISAVRNDDKMEVLIPLITKGTSLPAMGTKKFVTQCTIRPGKKEDVLKLIIWEGLGETRASRNTLMKTITVSGDMLPTLLPEGSDIEVTIRMDESRLAKISAYFPYMDETIDHIIDPNECFDSIDATELRARVSEERQRLSELRSKADTLVEIEESKIDDLDESLDDIDDEFGGGRVGSNSLPQIQKHLNEISIIIDDIEMATKWPSAVLEIEQEIEWAQAIVKRWGDSHDGQVVQKHAADARKAIDLKIIGQVEVVAEKLRAVRFTILFAQPEYWIGTLKDIVDHFAEINWIDVVQARSMCKRGTTSLNTKGFTDEIKEVVSGLWDLMSPTEKENYKTPRTDIPHYR